ncbi:MAG: type II CAAX endopeptidase family protein [Akkermansia sp.]
MSIIASQYISIITATLLLVLAVTSIIRIKTNHFSLDQKGIPTSGFTFRDGAIGIFLILFYSLTPLSVAFSSHETPPPLNLAQLVNNLILQGIIGITILTRLLNHKIAPGVGWGNFRPLSALPYIILSIITVLLMVSLMQYSGLAEWISRQTQSSLYQDSIIALQNGPLPVKITLAITAALFAPFVEEFGFRAYLYPMIKKITGPLFACLTTSLLFGIVHMNLAMLIPLTLFGIILVFIYEKTKTIWVPIAAHVIFNSLTIINIFLLPALTQS